MNEWEDKDWEAELIEPIPARYLKDMPHMPGFTSIEVYYVIHRLNQVLGRDGWYVELTHGPELIGKEVVATGKFWWRVPQEPREGPQEPQRELWRHHVVSGGVRVTKSVGDAYKGATSRLISHGASLIGVGEEIYLSGSLDTHLAYHVPPDSRQGNRESHHLETGRVVDARTGEEIEPPTDRHRQEENFPHNARGIPTCPQCGGTLKRRQVKQGPRAGSEFWGCANWRPGGQGCDFVRSIPS